MRKSDISLTKSGPQVIGSAKCTGVETGMPRQRLASRGNTARPMTIAAVKRASLKMIVGSTSVKTYNKAICTRLPRFAPATSITS